MTEDTGWIGLAMEATSAIPAVDAWIHHAKFHATSDDRGYPTGLFDWERFHDAMTDPKFRPCCAMAHVVVEWRVTEVFDREWWDAYREALFVYLAHQRDLAVEAA